MGLFVVVIPRIALTFGATNFNLRPTGGGGAISSPPSRFLAISSKPMQVSPVHSLPTILHIVLKF